MLVRVTHKEKIHIVFAVSSIGCVLTAQVCICICLGISNFIGKYTVLYLSEAWTKYPCLHFMDMLY